MLTALLRQILILQSHFRIIYSQQILANRRFSIMSRQAIQPWIIQILVRTKASISHFYLRIQLRRRSFGGTVGYTIVSNGTILNWIAIESLTRQIRTIVVGLMNVHLCIIALVIASLIWIWILISVDLWNVRLIKFLLVSFFSLVFLLLLTLLRYNLVCTRVQAQTGAARLTRLVLRIRSAAANFTCGPLYSLLTWRIHLTILLLKLINQPITSSYWILSTSYHIWIKTSGYYLLMLF